MESSSPTLKLCGKEHSHCTPWAQRTVDPKLSLPKIQLLDFLYGEWGVVTLDFLCILLPNLMLLWVNVPLVRSPSVGVKSRDTKWLQQVLEFEEDCILPSPKDVRQHRATVMIDRMP